MLGRPVLGRRGGATRWAAPALSRDTYAARVLRTLRDPEGGPALRVRLVAALLALGLLLLSAPAVLPVLRALLSLLF